MVEVEGDAWGAAVIPDRGNGCRLTGGSILGSSLIDIRAGCSKPASESCSFCFRVFKAPPLPKIACPSSEPPGRFHSSTTRNSFKAFPPSFVATSVSQVQLLRMLSFKSLRRPGVCRSPSFWRSLSNRCTLQRSGSCHFHMPCLLQTMATLSSLDHTAVHLPRLSGLLPLDTVGTCVSSLLPGGRRKDIGLGNDGAQHS